MIDTNTRGKPYSLYKKMHMPLPFSLITLIKEERNTHSKNMPMPMPKSIKHTLTYF